MRETEDSLGIVSAMYANRSNDELYIHLSFGRIIDSLAQEYDKVYLCVPVIDSEPGESRDYKISASNIELVPQPPYTSSFGALGNPLGVLKSYFLLCAKGGKLFIRGMVPFIGGLYLMAFFRGVRTCHWLVGNPEALLKTHKRSGGFRGLAEKFVARADRLFSVIGRKMCQGTFLCNGNELKDLYASPGTRVVVSSTIFQDEIHYRVDSCTHEVITLLFVGFLRPEKGVEYLIRALPELKISKKWKLVIVGDFDKFGDYRNFVLDTVKELGVTENIDWMGYIPFGDKLFSVMRSADLLVLPTLSEGTPRVLVEARASGLPVVASDVGGIPSSISNGHDGMLVPPKNPLAIANAISEVVEDSTLRMSLIENGYRSVSRFTVEAFTEQVVELYKLRSS